MADQKICIVCREPCIEDPTTRYPEDRWHWGPDEAYCHFRCEKDYWPALEKHYLDRSRAAEKRSGGTQ